MTELANALKPDELEQRGFGLYEQFRPVIPEGVVGSELLIRRTVFDRRGK
jgi:hypothetical protein